MNAVVAEGAPGNLSGVTLQNVLSGANCTKVQFEGSRDRLTEGKR